MLCRIRKALRGEASRTVGGAAFIIAVAGIISRLLGFLRDRLLAGQFGAGDILDAYYAAFRIPDFMYNLLVLGALSAAFVPVFTELHIEKKEEEAWGLSRGMLHLIILLLGLSAVVIIVFAPWLMQLLTPGFSVEKQALTVEMTRIMLLSPLFLGVSAVFGGALISLKRFFLYSLAPIFYNLGIIFGALVLAPSMGPRGLAWGVVAGAFLHALTQYSDVRHVGFRYRFSREELWRNPLVTKVTRMMIPRSIGVAVNQFGFFVVTIFASTLASGSLTAFTLANNIQSVPLGLFGVAFSLAVFPSLSALTAKHAHEEFFRLFARTFQRILFFVLPVGVFIFILRAQIVRVILGSGKFDWQDTIATFSVLGILSVSLFAQSLIQLLARAFFALKDTHSPLYAALFAGVLHILLTFVLVKSFGIEGVAWAFSLATILNFFLLYMMLRARMRGEWSDRVLVVPAAKIALAAIAAGVVAQFTKSLFGFHEARLDTFWEIFTQFFVTAFVGGGVFAWLGWLMKIEELEHLRCFLIKRILGQPQMLVEAEKETESGA